MFVLVTHLPTGMHPPSNGFTELPCWTVTDSHIDTAVEKKACVFAHSVSLPKSSKGQRNGSGRMVEERVSRVSNLLRVGLND